VPTHAWQTDLRFPCGCAKKLRVKIVDNPTYVWAHYEINEAQLYILCL